MNNNHPNFYHFLAVFNYYKGGISITFPDLHGCVSHGENDDEALKNAKDVLKLHLYGMEEDNEGIPSPSSIKDIKLGKNDVPVMIDVFMPSFRAKMDSKYIKKTLSIPNWLNKSAEEAGINFSQTLQEALKQQLNL